MSPDLLINELITYLRDGGFVMPPLLLFACLLWYGLGERMLILRRGVSGDLTQIMRSGSRPSAGVLGDAWLRIRGEINVMLSAEELTARLEETLHPLRQTLNRNRVMVRSIVIIAPLAGLLGTVAGMIETFDSLGDGALFAASGGVAGGISQALLTTQMGLVVAIPGVILGRLLDRRQNALEDDLDQLVAYVANEPERCAS